MKEKKSVIERIGDRLPNINMIFLILTGIIILASFFLKGTYTFTGIEGESTVNNMISVEGFQWIIMHLQSNFIGYSPLGLVLISVLGTSIAEKTGLFNTLIKRLGHAVPDGLLIPATMFLGIMSSVASDVGYIVLLPLAAILFAGLGKNPVLGILTAFAGVSAGFGANLFPTPGDGLLGKITTGVVEDNGIAFALNEVTMNLYFMIASTFLLTFVGWFVTSKFIAPKLKNRKYEVPSEYQGSDNATPAIENKALKWAGIGLAIYLVALIALSLSPAANIYTDSTGALVPAGTAGATVNNLVLKYLIIFLVFAFLIPGFIYGTIVGKIKNATDYVGIVAEGFKDNASLLVIAFFAGNFIAIFEYSGLGDLISKQGAELLLNSGLNNQPYLLLIAFILITAFVNIFIGSASAKWTLLAPIFIPMLVTANPDMTPEIVQAAYRVADSSTNIITPLMSYMPIILALVNKFDKDFNIGTMIQLMSRYSIAFLIMWTGLLLVWFAFGIPFGI